jgi:DNA-binding NarL/FixJ family response regulator
MGTGESRNQRSFVLVTNTEALASEARRALAPYRRTRCIRDVREARALFEREGPPLGVVVEMHLAEESGFDVLRDLRERFPFVPALLLAASPSPAELERGYALRAAHVALPLTGDSLMPFVFRALTEEVVSDERVGFLVESLVRAGVLTLREAELLVLVIGDMPRERIIERMAISENTLKGHVRALLRKLEAGDLDKLAARVFRVALQNGGRAATGEPPRVYDADATDRYERDHQSSPASPSDRKRAG